MFNTLLRREQPIFERETHVYFQDVFDLLIRVSDTIDNLRDMLSSTMDAYLSVSGNRMNQVMKRLTSISTILMSVTLVAGIYGMNFNYMPELHWRYGYVFALLSMIGVGVLHILEEGQMAMNIRNPFHGNRKEEERHGSTRRQTRRRSKSRTHTRPHSGANGHGNGTGPG